MKCRVCNSPRIYPYKNVRGVSLYQCRNCFLAFVDPKTPRKDTNNIYAFTEYQKREKQFRRRYTNTIALLKKCACGPRILEVGAGFGLLSSLLAEKGYTVDALEPLVTPIYLKNSTVQVIKKSFTSFAQKTIKKYDAIILYDVFEHVDDPKETILLFKKLLKKNGIIVIQTPNYLSYMAAIVKDWSWWMVEDHRFFYSKQSLARLFSKKTWEACYYHTYEEWIDFKKNLDGNFGTNKIMKYLFFSWWIPYYFLLKHLIWALGKGGLILTIYRKK